MIATGGTQGVYYQYGLALQKVIAPALGPITVVATTGSVANIDLVTKGQATFALVSADVADAAAAGQAPFTAPVPLSAIALLYDDYLHLVVRAESPVHAVAGLRGLRVSTGPGGSGTELIADRILAADGLDPRTGIDPSALSINDSVTALEAGRIDAFFWSGGLPTAGMAALARTTPIRLIGLAGEAAALRARYGPAYRTGTIPAGTYTAVPEAVTLAVPNLLVTLDTTPDPLVHRLTQSLFADVGALGLAAPVAAQLDLRTAIYTEPVWLHHGALAYYWSVKTLM